MRAILCITLMLWLGAPYACSAENAEQGNAPAESVYTYSQDDIPAVFFFPSDKARWDGAKVTMREWYTLTELQKEKFISEYVGELQKQYNQAIDVFGADYLRALNLFSRYSNENSLGAAPTRVIDALLTGQGKISPLEHNKPAGNGK